MSSSSSLKGRDTDLEKDAEIRDPSIPATAGGVLDHEKDHDIPGTTPSHTPDIKEDASFRVDWEEGDPANPRNFSFWYKSWITFQLGMLALASSQASAIISPASQAISEHFDISSEVTVLNVSLYIVGFAVGPLMWAPVSELFGRKWSILPAMYALTLFSIGTATSKTPAAMFITRFFGGAFGSAPVSNVSAALGDIYEPKARGFAVSLYAVAVVGGPTIAPVIGAALVVNPALGWRWTEYITAIWVFVVATVTLFCMPELYAPVLLKQKASRLRKETGDQRYWHPHEENKLDFKSIVTKHLSRPLLMLTTEPMVTCIAFYASFVYALLYLTLEVFPIVFSEDRGWSLVVSTLPFLALFVGVLFALSINLANQPRYARIVDSNNGKPVPEARLAPMVVGGVLFAIGLFWFGWTASPSIPWPVPVVAAAFIGAGFNIIFNQCINFLVDTYGVYAASAVSANTFLRSILAAGLPMAAKSMFHTLGVGPAMSILGGVATLALPVPFLFMRYGLKLRKMSKFAPVVEERDDRSKDMEQSGSGINQSFSPPQATADSQHDKTNNMDDPTAQIAEQTLPELIRFMLEHMRGLRLRCPPTFQPEDYVNVWQCLAAAGNYLIGQIEDLRFEGHGQWETGDEASTQQFGRLAVLQGKEFLRRVLRELASLGTKWHLSSTRAGIDTQPFDPNHVPRLLELETPIVGVKMEDSETDDAKKEAVQEDVAEKEILKEAVIEPEVIKTEAVKPPPQDTVLPSIESTNSFKTPTTPRPADYKTPPRGPSFSPITPPQAVAETNNNSNSNSNSNIAQPHPPLQYPDDQRFRNYLSSINFDANMLSMFNFPTPTDVQEEISPRPRLASQAPVPAPASALAAQKYMDSVRLVVENIVALVFLMLPEPER